MKTISEKARHTGHPNISQAAPRMQKAMSIAQREQSVAIKQFFKSRRRAKRPEAQEAAAINIALGAR